jgi:hypothetical protein
LLWGNDRQSHQDFEINRSVIILCDNRENKALYDMASTSSSLFDHPRALIVTFMVAAGLFFWQQRDAFGPAADLLLPDTDDAMRLVQVKDWLNGQSWFDTTQHRYLPPSGGIMHWSRLIDLPLAGLILFLTPLAGREMAEILTVILWPSLIFAAYLALIGNQIKQLFGQKVACYALLAAAMQPLLTALAMPGRIDHHNVQYLVITAMVFAAVSQPKIIWLSGALAALSLAIGFETFPFVAVLGIFLAVIWMLSGEKKDAGRLFGWSLSLFSGAMLAFWLQNGQWPWAQIYCDTLAAPSLLLLGLTTIAMAALPVLSQHHLQKTKVSRGILLASAGLLILGLCLWLFPSCAAGPYAGLSDIVRLQWLPKVLEAMPLVAAVSAYPESSLATFGPLLIAIPLLVAASFREKEQARLVLSMSAVMVVAGFLLGFVQVRSAYIASAFIPLAAGYGIVWLLQCLEHRKSIFKRIMAAMMVILLFSASWVLPLKMLSSLGLGEEPPILRPAEGLKAENLRQLNVLPPGIVMSMIDMGPSLLLHTHHAIIAAPYHRNTAGLLAALQGLGGNEVDLHHVMSENKAVYLMLPKNVDTLPPASIGAKIAGGTASPAWLERMPVSTDRLQVWKMRLDF